MSNIVRGPIEGESPFLSVHSIAARLCLSPRTVRRWIESGRLKAVRTSAIRGRFRVSPASLAAFLDRSEVAVPHDEHDPLQPSSVVADVEAGAS